MQKNKLLALALLGVMAVSPAHARVFSPETITLENGLQVVVIPNSRAPVVTHMLWLKSGAMNDPWGTSGVAHFLEHLMFKGTTKHPEGDYSKIISHLGGEQNAFTSNDYTAYHATVDKEHLETVMELESDRLSDWQVTDAEIATERDVILKERQQRTENDPVNAFFEEVNTLLYPNHPYQRPTIGWQKEMATLSRADATTFFKKYYAPNNLILVLSGDVTLKEVTPLVKKYYAGLARADTPPRPTPIVPAMDTRRRIEKSSPLMTQTIWSAHMLVEPARPETIAQSDAMMVMNKILGDSRTGRLYRRLVVAEKLATSAYVVFDMINYGPARLTIGVVPNPGADLNRIEAIVSEEVNKIANEKVSAVELKNAAQSLEIAAVYARDSVMGPAMAVGEALVEELDIPTIEAWPQRMRNVTADAVQAQAKILAAKYRTPVIAILTPEKK